MIRGVNLGGWLVLERWITPSLFAGLAARDEYSYCQELGAAAAAKLRVHRDTFVTEADFAWLATHGLNAVRIPVGYWLFGDEKPFHGTVAYLDRALAWAERYGLGVVIDLHGLPGSQNGRDHSGRLGTVGWKTPEHIARSLDIVERIAARYKDCPGLIGIELMNEPGARLGRRALRRYYQQGYERVRAQCGERVAVIIADTFQPWWWRPLLSGRRYQNVWLDVHLYQVFSGRDRRRNLAAHLKKVQRNWQRLIRITQQHQPVMIGEWSLALDAQTFAGMDKPTRDAAMRAYALMQVHVFDGAASWFFWTYRTEGGGGWSYHDSVQRDWLPASYDVIK